MFEITATEAADLMIAAVYCLFGALSMGLVVLMSVTNDR